MSTTVRPYEKGEKLGFEVDIRFEWPDGTAFRRRRLAPVNTENQAQRWGEDLERRIFAQGKEGLLARSKREEPTRPAITKEVPTLAEFWPLFIKGHCEGNRHKPSSVERKESAYRTWLAEALGPKRLDTIGAADIVRLKGELANSKAKSANNVLTALSACLKFAGPDGVRRSEGLGIIERVPRVRLLPIDTDEKPEWYEEPDYQRLVSAAAQTTAMVLVLILLAGDAGLRKAEIAALKWTDLDMKRRIVHVQRSIWEGREGEKHETTPKGGRGRAVDMTEALHSALTKLPRRVDKERVIYLHDGQLPTDRIVQRLYSHVQRDAGIKVSGGIHRLRHTFVSRLAVLGAPAVVIQKLAGHASITTTMRYMHVAPNNMSDAIRLLDQARAPELGETVEKAGA